jgi:hypothetical protein
MIAKRSLLIPQGNLIGQVAGPARTTNPEPILYLANSLIMRGDRNAIISPSYF